MHDNTILRRATRRIAALCGALALLATSGCASFLTSDTTPLPASKLQPPGAERISKGGYRLEALPVSPDTPDMIVLVAFSGGGKRSASFGYGAIRGMRDVMVRTAHGSRPLLDEVDAMAGVSGGSFPAAYYGLYRDKMFGRFETDFLYQDTNSNILGIYLLPWNWTWIADPTIGTNDFMDRVYDRTMFHGATYADLERNGRPMVAIGATDISYGTPFLFTQESFDLICADLSPFPLSRAVAASNGFPGLFSPITLTNRAKDCAGRKPGWLTHVPLAEKQDPLSRVGVQAVRAERYLDADRTTYLHLADGGISDNLAMRVAGSTMETLSANEANLRRLLATRRVLVISIDGQGTQDSTVAQRRLVGGLFSVLGLVSGAQIDSYNFETLRTMNGQLRDVKQRLARARCAAGVDGTGCRDVDARLVHISLAAMPDSPDKARLLAIPTGLSIPRADVDLLVRSGEQAVTGSAALRQFLDAYPPIATEPPSRAVAAAAR